MSYETVILKDKKDLTDQVLDLLPKANVLGAYENPDHINFDEIEVLSVKFSRVGKVTLDRFPNLKWIVCRSHGIDTVNRDDCVKRNVGIVAMNPHSTQCANWIYDKMTNFDSVTIFGNGSISKALQSKLNNYNLVDSKTERHEIDEYLKNSNTVISVLPLNPSTENYFDEYKFNLMPNGVNFISISRGDLFNPDDLNEFVIGQKLNEGHFDMLPTKHRENIVKHPTVSYYDHTSFEFGDVAQNQYGQKLKQLVDKCLTDEIKEPELGRTENIWF